MFFFSHSVTYIQRALSGSVDTTEPEGCHSSRVKYTNLDGMIGAVGVSNDYDIPGSTD